MMTGACIAILIGHEGEISKVHSKDLAQLSAQWCLLVSRTDCNVSFNTYCLFFSLLFRLLVFAVISGFGSLTGLKLLFDDSSFTANVKKVQDSVQTSR